MVCQGARYDNVVCGGSSNSLLSTVHFDALAQDLSIVQDNIPEDMHVEVSVFVTGMSKRQADLRLPSLHSNEEQTSEDHVHATSGEPKLGPETPELGCDKENACTSNSVDRFFDLKYGKPIIAEVLSNEVSLCGDSVAVCGKDSLILRFYASRRIILVSGPQSLIDDVRGTLRKPNVAGPMTVLRGGPSVFLHVEHFGM